VTRWRGLPRIDEALRQPADDAGSLERLAQQHGAGVAGQALGAGLDKQAGVEGGGEER